MTEGVWYRIFQVINFCTFLGPSPTCKLAETPCHKIDTTIPCLIWSHSLAVFICNTDIHSVCTICVYIYLSVLKTVSFMLSHYK